MSEPTEPSIPVTSPRTIATGITALATGEISGRFIAFAATAWLTRKLGPDGFGIIGFATAISSYLLIAASTGLNDIGMREVAKKPLAASEIAISAIVVRLLLAATAWIVLGAIALFLPKPPGVRIVVFLAGLSFFSQALDTAWVFKGLERQVRVGVAGVTSQVLYAVGILTFVRAPADVIWVPVLQFAGELGAALWIGLGLFRHGLPRITLEPGRAILRASGFITVSRLLRVVILTGGIVLLGLLAGERAVGLFSASYRFCFLLMAIAGAISTAFLPSFARAMYAPEALSKLTQFALRVSAVVGAPLVVGGIITARPLLELLFGAPFGEAAPTLQFLLVGIGCVFIHGALHNLFLVLHRTHTETVIFGFAAAVALVFSIWLIPHYSAVGAGAATAAAEASIAVIGWLVIRRCGVHVGWRPFAAPAVAAAAMAAGLLALPALPLPATVAIGTVIYGSVLALSGASPRSLLSPVVSSTSSSDRD